MGSHFTDTSAVLSGRRVSGEDVTFAGSGAPKLKSGNVCQRTSQWPGADPTQGPCVLKARVGAQGTRLRAGVHRCRLLHLSSSVLSLGRPSGGAAGQVADAQTFAADSPGGGVSKVTAPSGLCSPEASAGPQMAVFSRVSPFSCKAPWDRSPASPPP